MHTAAACGPNTSHKCIPYQLHGQLAGRSFPFAGALRPCSVAWPLYKPRPAPSPVPHVRLVGHAPFPSLHTPGPCLSPLLLNASHSLLLPAHFPPRSSLPVRFSHCYPLPSQYPLNPWRPPAADCPSARPSPAQGNDPGRDGLTMHGQCEALLQLKARKLLYPGWQCTCGEGLVSILMCTSCDSSAPVHPPPAPSPHSLRTCDTPAPGDPCSPLPEHRAHPSPPLNLHRCAEDGAPWRPEDNQARHQG